MSLSGLYWTGDLYSLCIRRHWSTFFRLATIFKIQVPPMEKILSEGAGHHIQSIHGLCETAKEYFETVDDWWLFSKQLCDQYCEFYVLEKESRSNSFSMFHSTYCNDRYVVQNFAKISKGYVGPEEWKLT